MKKTDEILIDGTEIFEIYMKTPGELARFLVDAISWVALYFENMGPMPYSEVHDVLLTMMEYMAIPWLEKPEDREIMADGFKHLYAMDHIEKLDLNIREISKAFIFAGTKCILKERDKEGILTLWRVYDILKEYHDERAKNSKAA